MPLSLTEQDVTRLLTMEDALAAVEAVFKAQAAGDATNEPRRRLRASGAVLQVMSGAVAGFKDSSGGEYKGLLGLKSYLVTRNKARFYVNLYDAQSGELLPLIAADKLGQSRTRAASRVAPKYRASADAKTVGVYGAGWQAESQVEAVCAARKIESVKVYSRSPENRERFCEEMGARLAGVKIAPVE